MVLCKRRGCGVDFEAGTASAEATCRYHPGAPVFHEGLKSWSCCKDTNKPVMEFEQFMQLPGCATATSHTTETQPLPETAKSVATPASNAADSMAASLQSIKISQPAAPPKPTEPAPPAPEPRDADTVTSVAAGTTCRRPGCGFVAESAITNRDRVSEMCKYHKGTPIFHEGSKGYSCCKPRVLHFDDFLQIKPCTQAEHGHLFTAPAPTEGDRVECRIDHYETPSDVRVTVYAKGVDAEQSVIEIHENEVCIREKHSHPGYPLSPAGTNAQCAAYAPLCAHVAALRTDQAGCIIVYTRQDEAGLGAVKAGRRPELADPGARRTHLRLWLDVWPSVMVYRAWHSKPHQKAG